MQRMETCTPMNSMKNRSIQKIPEWAKFERIPTLREEITELIMELPQNYKFNYLIIYERLQKTSKRKFTGHNVREHIGRMAEKGILFHDGDYTVYKKRKLKLYYRK